MDEGEIWRRVEALEKTPETEALEFLRRFLERAQRRGDDPEEALPEAAVLVMSALGRVDQREDEREDLLSQLRSEGRWSPEVVELLRRLVDREAADRLQDPDDALSALEEASPAIRDHEAAVRWAERRPPDPVAEDPAQVARQRRVAGVGCALLVSVVIGLFVYKLVSSHLADSSLEVATRVEGTTVELWSLEEEAGRLSAGVSWADRLVSASSTDRIVRGRWEWLLGRPEATSAEEIDDSLDAWRPSEPDQGDEWIVVEWGSPVRTRAVVVVEGTNPGALAAIDDIVDLREATLGAKRYERLWEGRLPPAEEGGRYVLFHLAEPRRIHGLRVILETSRVVGNNSIDTVGLRMD